MKVKSKPIIIEGKINPYNFGVWQMFENNLKLKNRSGNTIYSYQSDLFQFFRYLYTYKGDKKYTDLETKDIEDYIKFCMDNGNNEDRIKRRCSSMSSFLLFLRRNKLITNHPMEFLDRPVKKLDVMEKHFLSETQVNDLKSKLIHLNDIRIETYVILSLSTAARKNAIRNIKWSDIDFEGREIKAIEKGPKEVTLVFSEEAKNKLLELKQYYKDNEIYSPYVFVTFSHGNVKQAGKSALKEWAHKAGKLIDISNFTPHSFRRTTATRLHTKGMNTENVQVVLNHNSIESTMRYIKQSKQKILDEKDSYGI